MATFIIGLVILFGGAALYGRFCEKVFGPDDRQTPAYAKQDGVDYIPMKGWRNSLINLLNIAGQDDPVGDMGAGVRRTHDAFKRAGVRDVTLKLYPGLRHEILNEAAMRDTVYGDIGAWLDRVLG